MIYYILPHRIKTLKLLYRREPLRRSRLNSIAISTIPKIIHIFQFYKTQLRVTTIRIIELLERHRQTSNRQMQKKFDCLRISSDKLTTKNIYQPNADDFSLKSGVMCASPISKQCLLALMTKHIHVQENCLSVQEILLGADPLVQIKRHDGRGYYRDLLSK